MADRAILFIDGNNWYHALRDAGREDPGRLNYAKVSRKLIGPRHWLGTRYYVGQVKQQLDAALYGAQRRFLARIARTDARISVHLGRLESQPSSNPGADELAQYLDRLSTRIDAKVYRELVALAARHRRAEVFVEKAVDVMIAVDMVLFAVQDKYDAAYLLSADGDFTPAAAAIRSFGKRVYAASPGFGAELAASVNAFIRITPGWFDDCM